MDLELLLKYATVGMGCVAAFCSFALGAYFWRSSEKVGRSAAYVFFGEGVGLCITVVFSIGAGVLNVIVHPWDMVLRWIMFAAALASSVHMAFSIDDILRKR